MFLLIAIPIAEALPSKNLNTSHVLINPHPYLSPPWTKYLNTSHVLINRKLRVWRKV